jgi:polysaccharide pyruvyl transferase WcaK-like protein
LAHLASRAVREGHDVVLFPTNRADWQALADTRARITTLLTPEQLTHVTAATVDGVSELMNVLASIDVVVAARLHGVLLSHIAGRPTLALAHERKVTALMSDMSQSPFCVEIDNVDPAAAWPLLAELISDRARIGAQLLKAVAHLRAQVEEQYEHVFGASRQ